MTGSRSNKGSGVGAGSFCFGTRKLFCLAPDIRRGEWGDVYVRAGCDRKIDNVFAIAWTTIFRLSGGRMLVGRAPF